MSLRDHLVDLGPLRENRPFRAFWAGSAISTLGSQMAAFALTYYVWRVTQSAVVLGLVGVVQGVPMVVFAPVGGHLADTMNRRTVLMCTRAAQLVVSTGAAVVVLAGVRSVPVLFGVLGAGAALSSLGAPVAQSIPPRMLTGTSLPAGLALTRLGGQLAMLIGPAVGGALVASTGVGTCLVIDPLSFVAALWGVSRVPEGAARPLGDDGSRRRALPDAVEGVRLVLGTPVIRGAFLVDLCATVLALPAALFPVINAERFSGSPITLGLMLPAVGLGGVVAGLLSGRLTAHRHQGRLMLISCATWGLATAAFGASGTLPLALAALAVAGAADTCTVVSRGTIVQSDTPDALRGRVNALDYLVGAGAPKLGDLRAGLVAGVTSGAVSCVLGGLACVVGATVIASATPRLRRWQLPAGVE